jgi:arginine deiminase
MGYGAQSEYGKLKSVLMHIPGEEINIVNGSNREDYLFREVPYLDKFREEHEKFVKILKEEGVKVYLVEEGVDGELLEAIKLCPNMVFTRDTGTVTKNGAIIGRMNHHARSVEPIIVMEALKNIGVPIQMVMDAPAIFEGGDAVWLNEETLMIGYGPRTNEEAVKRILMNGLGKTFKNLISVPLPMRRVHLDGGLMILSNNIAVTRIEDISMYPSKMYMDDGKIRIINLAKWLMEKGYELITVTDREDRVFGANLVAIGDRKVLSYIWNRRIMRELERRGFDVIGVEGYELVKGGGGLHCMILPIERESIKI